MVFGRASMSAWKALEILGISVILRRVEWILHNIGCVEWDSPI